MKLTKAQTRVLVAMYGGYDLVEYLSLIENALFGGYRTLGPQVRAKLNYVLKNHSGQQIKVAYPTFWTLFKTCWITKGKTAEGRTTFRMTPKAQVKARPLYVEQMKREAANEARRKAAQINAMHRRLTTPETRRKSRAAAKRMAEVSQGMARWSATSSKSTRRISASNTSSPLRTTTN